MFYRVEVKEHNVAFVFKNGKFLKILKSGVYKLFTLSKNIVVYHVGLKNPMLQFEEAAALVDKQELASSIKKVIVTESERVLVKIDGLLQNILTKGVYYFYLGNESLKLESVNVSDTFVTDDHINILKHHGTARQYIDILAVPHGFKGVLFFDNKKQAILEAGTYYFWKNGTTVNLTNIDLRKENIEVQGQELMTKDKVTLRINLSAQYMVTDLEKVIDSQSDYSDALYRTLQLALRAAVSSKTLDQLLSMKDEISKEITDTVQSEMEDMGLAVSYAGIRDIILPGEMKHILNRVIEAEKTAQANMIQRREETAATRSLLNTAKLIGDNPVLMRLKELEAAERMAEKIDCIQVSGGVESVFEALVKK